MVKRLLMALVLLVMAIGTVTAVPITIDVAPIDNEVLPGEDATYTVHVISDSNVAEDIKLYIPEAQKKTGWGYIFTPNDEFTISPYGTVDCTLTISVPGGTSVGSYYHDVNGIARYYDPDFEEWFEGESAYLDVLTTVIPEFTTIAIPVAAVLGLVFLFNRKRRG